MQSKILNIVTVLLAVTVVVPSGALANDREHTLGVQLVRADELIGSVIRDIRGEEIGRVTELLLDPPGASVSHAVIASGDFLGLGGKRHAVPWHDLQLTGVKPGSDRAGDDYGDHSGAIVINKSMDQLKQSSPPLDRNSWSEYDPEDKGLASRRVTDILGSDVNTQNEEDIGEVEDLVIDVDRGRIVYALVDYDGDWDLDADVLSVPWPYLNRAGAVIISPLDENSARQLGYRTDDFARLGDRDHRDRLYGVTGSRGYWEDDTASGEGGVGAVGERVTVTGIIDSVMSKTAETSVDSGRSFTFQLEQDGGNIVTVDASAKAALDRQNLTLSKGDRVTVTGLRVVTGMSRTGDSGDVAEMIMADSIRKGSQLAKVDRSGAAHGRAKNEDNANQNQR